MLAPVPMIGAVVALLLFLDLAALQFLAKLPHPDQAFYSEGSHVYLESHGDRVLALRAGELSIDLKPRDLIEEPDVLPFQSEMMTFFDRQSLIYEILNAEDGEVVTTNGIVPLTYHVERLPGQLIFWIQLFVANVGALVGLAVWTFQRTNIAARHFAVTGVGLAISSMAASLYSSRPLAIDGPAFDVLSHLNFLGVCIFCCGFFCMMLNYPKPLTKFPVSVMWYLLMALIFVIDYCLIVDSLDITRRMPAIVTLLLAAAALCLQWRGSSRDPLVRQSLLWFVAVTLSGSFFFIAVIFVPPLLGEGTTISQGLAFLAFLTIYVGLAVGVARYPLFDLQQYWVKTMIWMVGGLIVISLNLGIATWFGLSNITALGMIVLTFVTVALPLRAAGTRYIFNRASRNFQQHLPQIVARMSDSAEKDVARIWQDEVMEIFRPLEVTRESISVVKPTVVKQGIGFVVPAIEGGASYHLTYADEGTRLFSSLDVTLVETLKGLFEMNLSREAIASEATEAERTRLRKDIHDSLGGRLLTIMHSAEDDRVAAESRQAMVELREILAAVDSDSTLIGHAIDEWQPQLRGLVESAGANLDWLVDRELATLEAALSGRDRFNLGQILRECVTNAIKHAGAKEIAISLSALQGNLVAQVENDGEVSDPATWEEGIGTRNLAARAEELGAEIHRSLAVDRVRVRVLLPADRLLVSQD
ncbi:MAG: hypothetical protein JJ957_14690 [Pseudomonadales bacterium]|nr:hypothetical protein [Pseudomonadales bacterium]MBO6597028.1 hypothetical protein [Pseudomonadales bacterium]MBO6823786.1 hypothetical protein [Pseudomonadales bacterium]